MIESPRGLLFPHLFIQGNHYSPTHPVIECPSGVSPQHIQPYKVLGDNYSTTDSAIENSRGSALIQP